MIDLADLEATARAATQGEWGYDPTAWDEDVLELTTPSRVENSFVPIFTIDVGFDGEIGAEQHANAAYIAAAQPSVVLELIERIRAAEAKAGEPVAWEFFRSNGDGTSSPTIQRRKTAPTDASTEWPITPLYAAPVDTAALAERVKTLEEALRPFAQCSEVYPGSDPDIEAGFAGVHDRRCPLTIGDYHRARKALGGSNE